MLKTLGLKAVVRPFVVFLGVLRAFLMFVSQVLAAYFEAVMNYNFTVVFPFLLCLLLICLLMSLEDFCFFSLE